MEAVQVGRTSNPDVCKALQVRTIHYAAAISYEYYWCDRSWQNTELIKVVVVHDTETELSGVTASQMGKRNHLLSQIPRRLQGKQYAHVQAKPCPYVLNGKAVLFIKKKRARGQGLSHLKARLKSCWGRDKQRIDIEQEKAANVKEKKN